MVKIDEIAHIELQLSIEEELRTLSLNSLDEMSYLNPLQLDQSIFSDGTSNYVTRVINLFVSSKKIPLFWTRSDEPTKTFVTIPCEANETITMELDIDQHYKESGVLKIELRRYVNINDKALSETLNTLLNFIQKEDNSIHGLVLKYKPGNDIPMILTAGESSEP